MTFDIAQEFHVSVAVAGQLATINAFAEFAVAFLIGFLAIRFKHKSLLLSGVLLVAISAIGGFLSPNIGYMLFFFAVEGIGSVIVGVMATSLIGNTLPLKEKPKALSYVAAGTVATIAIGILTMGLLADAMGWRSIFIVFTLPVSVLSIGVAYYALPSRAPEELHYAGVKSYKTAFKQVFSNKSAAFCLIGGCLLGSTGLSVYTGTYFREVLDMPRNLLSYVLATITLVALVAYLVGGRLVNAIGRKKLTVASIIGSSITEMLVFLMPEMWTTVSADLVHVFLGWIGAIAITSYVLEQVPKSRSTMISVNSVIKNLSDVVAPAFGGVILGLISFDLLLSYRVAAFVFGAIGFVAAAVFYFLTIDPTRQTQQIPKPEQ